MGTLPTATDLAAFFHTGGTTGTPKLAAHTHANQVADAWMIAAHDGLDPQAPIFAALPLFHVNTPIVTFLSPLLRGQRSVWAGALGFRDPQLYRHFWKIVEHFRIGAMSGVPTVYATLAMCPVDADISSLGLAVFGAAPLPPSVAARFLGVTGVPLCERYGLTDATCATSHNFPTAVRAGSVGQRMAYQQVRAVAVAEDGSWIDLPTGEKGLLVIGGPTVFAGYVVGQEGGAHVLDALGKVRDGWLDTGDLGLVGADGYIALIGREKDLIIRGGHNIDPGTVEDVLLAHPAVAAAGVVGEPDVHAGEVPVAFVVLRPDADASREQVRTWAADRVVERAAAPKRVTVVESLPLTAVGKPFKPQLRVLATRLAVDETVANLDVVAIDAALGDGEVVVRVTAPADASDAVRDVLRDFTFPWSLEVAS